MPDRTGAPPLVTRMIAEAIGTLVLVLGGMGAALFAAGFAEGGETGSTGVGHLGVALGFGLSVLVAMYAWGPVSGGHFNPAVTLGLAFGGRFAWRDVVGYVVAQLIGALIGSTLLVLVGVFGPTDWLAKVQSGGFAANGFGAHSPAGWSVGAVIIVEVLLAWVFVMVWAGATARGAQRGFGPLAIGLAYALIVLVSLPIDNGSVNPVRSIAAALYGGVAAVSQVWVFIVFPLVGGAIAGIAHKALFPSPTPTR